MKEFVDVNNFIYKGKCLTDVGDGDSFCYCPCNVFGTPKMYYGDCHFMCADDALSDILDSLHINIDDYFDDDDFNSLTESLWMNSVGRGRLYYGKYLVVDEGIIPDKEYVDAVISYLGGTYSDYVILYNKNGRVCELRCDEDFTGKCFTNRRLKVPSELIRIYDMQHSKRDIVNKRFPTNMTRAQYYSLIRQENFERNLHKIIIESINKFLNGNIE